MNFDISDLLSRNAVNQTAKQNSLPLSVAAFSKDNAFLRCSISRFFLIAIDFLVHGIICISIN
jgi:hypothetical protein